jgi:cytoskeleton protein RodZ
MQTLGERLEEARKRKGLSIREAAEATKIRGDYLQKFESNSFGLDLPPLYVRGFVRAYARYLDFDPQRFLAEYDSLMAGESRAPRRETRENYGRVEFGDAAPESSGPRKGPDPMLLKYGLYGGGAVVLVIVIIVLIKAFSGGTADRPKGATQQQAIQSQAPTNVPGAQTITFTATGEVRLKIVQAADNRVLADSITLLPGDTRSFQKTGVWFVTVGDRTKIRMEIDGKHEPIPHLGATDPYGRFKFE